MMNWMKTLAKLAKIAKKRPRRQSGIGSRRREMAQRHKGTKGGEDEGEEFLRF